MSNEYPQSADDYNRHLADNIGFLKDSCEGYDNGKESEYKRLALTLRILLHDTSGRSKSLLGQLGMKSIKFLDTANKPLPGNTMAFCALAGMEIGPGKPRFIPHLDTHRKSAQLDFEVWWNGIIFTDSKGQSISRKELVLSVADQDGGAHVDPFINEKYGDLSRKNSMGWRVSFNGEDLGPMRAPEAASIRQISHEVLKTLLPGYQAKHRNVIGTVISGVSHSPHILPGHVDTFDSEAKLPRGAPCHCGSRKKYKKCHGAALRLE